MRLLILFTFLTLAVCGQARPKDLRTAIDSLDYVLKHAEDDYARQRIKITGLEAKAVRFGDEQRCALYKQIGDEFRRFDVDSAIYYYTAALHHADCDSAMIRRIIWARSAIMPVNGRVIEALEQFETHPPKDGDKDFLAEYYGAGARLYAYLIDNTSDVAMKREYADKSMKYLQQQMSCLPTNSPMYQYNKAELYCFQGDFTLGAAQAQELLGRLTPSDHLFAKTAALLADYYSRLSGKEEEQLYYLALAAMSDVKSATLESTALQKLGVELHKRGDVDRSYAYLMKSLEDAVNTGSKLRVVESAEYLPLISDSFKMQERKYHYILMSFVMVLTLALGFTGFLIWRLRRSGRSNEALRHRLQDENDLKDEYIQKILTMCSMYIERMEEFNRLAGRKIKAGQVQDLYQMIESGKIMQEQAAQFYEIFDRAFFGIHPEFVAQVNKLMQPDKQIVLPQPDRLTPELRILAFLRLGIDDSARLAKFLGLSLNTIYTYRNKLKSRALNRETFEDEVRKIDHIG